MPEPDRSRPAANPVVLVGGLLIAYLPVYGGWLARAAGADPGDAGPWRAIPLNWSVVAVLLGYVFLVERRGLASLRLVRPTGKDVEWAWYIWGATMVYAWLVGRFRPQNGNIGIETISAMPVLVVLALVVTTAVTEEILWRGYAVERFAALCGDRLWLGALLSAVVFAAGHVPFFGAEWLLYQGSGALALYGYYVWRRNLVGVMLLHLLGNLPILIPTVLS